MRLLMRPLDTHATRLISASLETPPSETKWVYDAYGNCVCFLQPQGQASFLKVVNNLVVDRFPAPLASVRHRQPPLHRADRLQPVGSGDLGALHRAGDGG